MDKKIKEIFGIEVMWHEDGIDNCWVFNIGIFQNHTMQDPDYRRNLREKLMEILDKFKIKYHRVSSLVINSAVAIDNIDDVFTMDKQKLRQLKQTMVEEFYKI